MSTPFIGAVISLVSKAEVRYEGTLYNIDPVKATVALQNGTPLVSVCLEACIFFPFLSAHSRLTSAVVWYRGPQGGWARGAGTQRPAV